MGGKETRTFQVYLKHKFLLAYKRRPVSNLAYAAHILNCEE